MLSYETLLYLKRNVLKARQNYSNIPESVIPTVRHSPPLFNMAITPIITSHLLCRKRGTRCKVLPPVTVLGQDWFHPDRKHTAIFRCLPLGDSLGVLGANSPTATGVKDSYVCIADHKATVRECISDLLFGYQAGSFSRIKSLCLVPSHHAYCSAGFFSLTFAPHFTQVAGIGLSPNAIRFATHNAELDALTHEISFRSGERRADLQLTALVVGSPRKGCDAFVRRLPAPCADGRVVTYSRRGRRGDRVVGRGGREIRPGNLR
ncbi:hypothetical protein EDB83DRAFT_2556863, partial [Lactarius deliciosus]